MTRKEQICDVAKEQFTYVKDENLKSALQFAFIDGVEWADKHSNFKSIWHDGTEYPKFEFEYIVYYSSHISKYEVDKPFNIINLYGGIEHLWSLVIKNLGITKWTYLETLLSKSDAKIV